VARTDLGTYSGHRLDDGTFAFYPVMPSGEISLLHVDGFEMPVTPPASQWYFAQRHTFPDGGHTGLDINLAKWPRGDVDLGEPVYATCNGLVVFAGMARGLSWGNLVITASLDGWPEGELLFWRYAHLQQVTVNVGQLVWKGQQVGKIGKGYNDRYYAHLHLDCWLGQMIAAEAWLTRWVNWQDPLEVWEGAGYSWEWGSV